MTTSKETKENVLFTDLKVGDRITFRTATARTLTGTVVIAAKDDGDTASIWLDKSSNAANTVEYDGDRKEIRKNVEKYGIKWMPNSPRLFIMDDVETITEKHESLSKVLPDIEDLAVGDRVELQLVEYNGRKQITRKVQGIYIGRDDDNEPVWWLDKRIINFQGAASYAVTGNASCEHLRPVLEKLGLDANEKRAWNLGLNSKNEDDTTVTRIITRANGSTTKGTNTMGTPATTEKSFLEKRKEEAIEAGYRTASNKMLDGFKAATIMAIRNKGGGNEKAEMAAAFLETEIGRAMLSAALGFGGEYIPKAKDDARFQKITHELRVNSMETVMTEIVNVVTDNVTPIIFDALRNLPGEETETGETVRVNAPPAKNDETATNGKSNSAVMGLGRN